MSSCRGIHIRQSYVTITEFTGQKGEKKRYDGTDVLDAIGSKSEEEIISKALFSEYDAIIENSKMYAYEVLHIR